MTVELTYTNVFDIQFDGFYSIPRKSRRLDDAINLAKDCLLLHNFGWADIIDANTGEVVAIVANKE